MVPDGRTVEVWPVLAYKATPVTTAAVPTPSAVQNHHRLSKGLVELAAGDASTSTGAAAGGAGAPNIAATDDDGAAGGGEVAFLSSTSAARCRSSSARDSATSSWARVRVRALGLVSSRR